MKTRIPRAVLGAIVVAVVLLGLHALGVRRSTAAIAGIFSGPTEVFLALVYIGCWFATVLITPIVVLTWALLAVDRRLRSRAS
ncbi:MAG: hypothetical protein AAF721_00695 [Myxococcota bacterium]